MGGQRHWIDAGRFRHADGHPRGHSRVERRIRIFCKVEPAHAATNRGSLPAVLVARQEPLGQGGERRFRFGRGREGRLTPLDAVDDDRRLAAGHIGRDFAMPSQSDALRPGRPPDPRPPECRAGLLTRPVPRPLPRPLPWGARCAIAPPAAAAPPSSSGLGRRPLTPETGVRFPLGAPAGGAGWRSGGRNKTCSGHHGRNRSGDG